jgi:hypothetical protein
MAILSNGLPSRNLMSPKVPFLNLVALRPLTHKRRCPHDRYRSLQSLIRRTLALPMSRRTPFLMFLKLTLK